MFTTELDLVTIPSIGKATPAPRKSAVHARPVPLGREDDRMSAPKDRQPPARYNQVPEHTEPLRMSQCSMDEVRVAVESCS